jgi:YaiO family outer membrane protein
MFAALGLTFLLSLAGDQGPVAAINRNEAEQLARSGRTGEALPQFEEIVRQQPHDVEARLWYARLLRRAGKSDTAEQEFRRALDQAPRHADALTGLASLLDMRGAHEEASALLDRAEQIAPGSVDVLTARAQHLRLAGRSSEAESYYNRAGVLRPEDADIRQSLEQIRRINRHRIEASLFTEGAAGTTRANAADVALDVRGTDRIRYHARFQAQTRFGQHEARAGGGIEWRARPDLTVRGSSLIGPGADIIARSDTSGALEHVRGRFESVLGIRYMAFQGARVWIFAPGGTFWMNDRTAVSARYYGSATAFGERPSVANHSGTVRLRLNVSPRVWLDTGYSRGVESFEQLSADRLGQFRADTVSGGVLYHLPGLQSLWTTLEYQRRSDDRTMVRLSAGVVHRF